MSAIKKHVLISIIYAVVLAVGLTAVGVVFRPDLSSGDNELPPLTVNLNDSYHKLIGEYEQQYGVLTVDEASPDDVPTGLMYVESTDFDGDNYDELMLTYRDPDMAQPQMDVYTHAGDGSASKIYSGPVTSGSDSPPALSMSHPNETPHWIKQETNRETLYTVQDGEFVSVKTFETDGKSIYRIDGKDVSKEEYESTYNEWSSGRTEMQLTNGNKVNLENGIVENKDKYQSGSNSGGAVTVPQKPTNVTNITVAPPVKPSNDYVSNQYYNEIYGSEGRYAFAIPQINLNSTDADKINSYLNSEYVPAAEDSVSEIRSSGYPYTSKGMDYQYAVNGDMLSVVFYSHQWPEVEAGDKFEVYNLSVSSGSTIWSDEVISKAGYSRSNYRSVLEEAIKGKMYEIYGDIALDVTIDSYYLDNAVPFMNKDGQLCVAAPVPSLAGADHYWYQLNLEDFDAAPNAAKKATTTSQKAQVASGYEAQRQLYTDYLTNGGYTPIAPSSNTSSWTIKTKMVDLDFDGTYELYIRIEDSSQGGVKGPATGSAILRIRNGNQVYEACRTDHGGGSMGGRKYDIYYDSSNGCPVLVRNDVFYEGVYHVAATLYVFTNINNIDNSSHIFEQESYDTSSSVYADAVDDIKNSTSLYKDDGSRIYTFKANGSYTDEDSYYSQMNRFVANYYSYHTGSYNNPIASQ